MIKFLNDNKNLYDPNIDLYTKSLDYAKNIENSENNNIIFHCLWRVPKEFGRKQLAVLKSIIVNHIDVLETLEINLWSNVDLSENVFFKEVEDFVTLRRWDLHNEIKGTILEDYGFLSDKNSINDDVCYLESDLFRLLILHKYGGFYIDMDVLVLRNFLQLNDFEFLYQWGTSGFRDEVFKINNAVMRLNKNSDLSFECLEILKEIPASKNSFDWGSGMFSNIKKNEILVLPGIWFDSEWGFEGTQSNPFIKVDNIELFDGAFTWHWHNRWDDDVEIGSKFQLIENKHNELFENLKLLK